MDLRFARLFTKKLIAQLKSDPIPDLAATLAFYFILSIFPLMIFVLAGVSFFEINNDEVQNLINAYFPGEIGDTFSRIVLNTIGEPQAGLLSIGILGTLWSASNGINAFIRSVNRAYNIEETRHFLKLRSIAIGLTVGMVLLIIITLALPVFGNQILNLLEAFLLLPTEVVAMLDNFRWIAAFAIMIVALMALYWIAPNAKQRFRDGLIGAIFATIGWQLISFFFSLYVSNYANYESTYGPLAGVIILMFWFFLTGIILIVGAEINATLHHLRKKKRLKRIETHYVGMMVAELTN
ncbi:YihY/virulence factor BrkB family protein [Shouchella clausii]|uniref:YihY/virulence factor BrkB family protein n=1 Tax=Shouchella clausii TaxID=79880 RepID=UPI00273ECD6E|nr:YihY/virulence factor BrkB family protein [Shouchella clausii]MDP5259933.1 YihY/virulence factor BrkB family protein [Shouchella clausii]MDP5267749.1 YihY/virulence factor BrkB family protein [Shouchella clausii]MDP5285508.1 YihY/virulence factor BrkB family protein [Shouchella clausii]MDP5305383.1 YihY/virulence factor BrkB family protein [Shouchella clausii]